MISISDLDSLAERLAAAQADRAKSLATLCASYVRLLRVAKPRLFQAMPTEYRDEDGHFDNSYPPKQRYRAHTGPRLLEIADAETEQIATSRGYYHTWKQVTTYGGLWVDIDGDWWRCTENGTGRVGQFAAHPGSCDVDVRLAWRKVPLRELEVDELELAEALLRRLATPVIVQPQVDAAVVE